jgi:hypothetical protein
MRRLGPWLVAALLGCNEPREPPAPPPGPPVPTTPAPPPVASRSDAGDPARALAAALAAANEARGATPCERAFDGYQQMRTAVERTTHPAPKLAPRETFLATCAQLPAEVQRCLELRWSVEHPKECLEAQGRLDPALQTKLQSLIVK